MATATATATRPIIDRSRRRTVLIVAVAAALAFGAGAATESLTSSTGTTSRQTNPEPRLRRTPTRKRSGTSSPRSPQTTATTSSSVSAPTCAPNSGPPPKKSPPPPSTTSAQTTSMPPTSPGRVRSPAHRTTSESSPEHSRPATDANTGGSWDDARAPHGRHNQGRNHDQSAITAAKDCHGEGDLGLLLAVAMVGAFATAGAATGSPRSGQLHVEKECPASPASPWVLHDHRLEPQCDRPRHEGHLHQPTRRKAPC